MTTDDRETFLVALQQAQKGFYFDAIENFQAVLQNSPTSPLADDATFNIGVCYMKVKQFAKAVEAFEKVLSEYPEGVIESELPGNEYGRTAAKALLGLVETSLLLNDRDKAEQYCTSLRPYSDSFILRSDSGQKVLFYQIARSMIDGIDTNKRR
jgi:tetratricopeptide (TPR) repeat protein